MKIWQKYYKYFYLGEWHIHTNFTDGKNNIFEYCEIARKLRIPLLAFTEHVRKNLSYDFYEFLSDLDRAQKQFPEIIILSGYEAKVLPDGSLDCPDEIIDKVNYRLFSFHSFPADVNRYIFCLKNIIKNYPIDVWAHPALFFKKNKELNLSENDLLEIFMLMNERNVYLELNIKYKLPSVFWIKKFIEVNGNKNYMLGSDIHSIKDLNSFWQFKKESQRYYQKMLTHKTDTTDFMGWFVENYADSFKIMKENPDETQKQFRTQKTH